LKIHQSGPYFNEIPIKQDMFQLKKHFFKKMAAHILQISLLFFPL